MNTHAFVDNRGSAHRPRDALPPIGKSPQGATLTSRAMLPPDCTSSRARQSQSRPKIMITGWNDRVLLSPWRCTDSLAAMPLQENQPGSFSLSTWWNSLRPLRVNGFLHVHRRANYSDFRGDFWRGCRRYQFECTVRISDLFEKLTPSYGSRLERKCTAQATQSQM